MFVRLAEGVVRHRRLVLVMTGVVVVVAAVVGSGVFDKLSGGGFEDPAAESSLAEDLLGSGFDAGDPDVVLTVTTDIGTVDDRSVADAGAALVEDLAAEPGVTAVVSYWTLGSPAPLRSQDATRALVLVRAGGSEDETEDVVARLRDNYDDARGPLTVMFGGPEPVGSDIGATIEEDLARAEILAVPVTLILLIVVYGSVVAALLPLAVGVIAVLGTFLSLSVIASVTDVSIFSINLTTALGLGLAIDYSLFVVSRFREELGRGLDPHTAVVRCVETAGRTIAFSALTVAVSLSALLVFPLYFLRSFAYAGVAVVLLAAVTAVVSLPALLAVLGHRVDNLRLWHRSSTPEGSGFWHRVATAVMRRPVPVATSVVALLVLLGLPFVGVTFGLPDDRVLPADAESRRVSDVLREEFDSRESDAFAVVAPELGDSDRREAEIDEYAARLSGLSGVARVDAVTGIYQDGQRLATETPAAERFASPSGTWFSVVPAVEPVSPDGEALVERIRDTGAPFEVLVAGAAAELVDSKDAIFGRLPLAGGIIAVTTSVLLFMMFGSLLVPAKAIVLNVLSLSATFGAMVWVFQDGHGADLLDFTATGTLVVTIPILMFCIAFGLSMDYEVFLLSRIKEEYDRTGDNNHAVALGLERTGGIVTAAAALLAVTFLAFGITARISFMKLFGFGLALAIVLDATIIRAALVPAFMRIAGAANWWAPAPLRRLHERFGIRENTETPARQGPRASSQERSRDEP